MNRLAARSSRREKNSTLFSFLSFTRRRRRSLARSATGPPPPSLPLLIYLSIYLSISRASHTNTNTHTRQQGPLLSSPHVAPRSDAATRDGIASRCPRAVREDPSSCPLLLHGLSISETHARYAVLCRAVLCSALLCCIVLCVGRPLRARPQMFRCSSSPRRPNTLCLSINGTARVRRTHLSLGADPLKITMSRIRVRSTTISCTLYRGESLRFALRQLPSLLLLLLLFDNNTKH